MTGKKNKYLIATTKAWNINEAERFRTTHGGDDILLVKNKRSLTREKVVRFGPDYIFFPHWSWKIPKYIYDNFECVVFHMTDLPFGRGGSPLQNLIARGYRKTKLSAIKVTGKMDAGPIFLKRRLSLEGTAGKIYERASKLIFREMIPFIIKFKPAPLPQKGKVVKFKRRSPQESDISPVKDIDKIYDHIRMLDAESYPKAYVETPSFKIEFSKAKKMGNSVIAEAEIAAKETR